MRFCSLYLFLTTAFVSLSLETTPKDLRLCSFHSENPRDRVKIVRRNFFKVAKNLPLWAVSLRKSSPNATEIDVFACLKIFQIGKKPSCLTCTIEKKF